MVTWHFGVLVSGPGTRVGPPNTKDVRVHGLVTVYTQGQFAALNSKPTTLNPVAII